MGITVSVSGFLLTSNLLTVKLPGPLSIASGNVDRRTLSQALKAKLPSPEGQTEGVHSIGTIETYRPSHSRALWLELGGSPVPSPILGLNPVPPANIPIPTKID